MSETFQQEIIQTLALLRSVIQSGEAWSGHCQEAYDRSVAALDSIDLVGYGLKTSFNEEWDGRTTIPLDEKDNYYPSAVLPLFAFTKKDQETE